VGLDVPVPSPNCGELLTKWSAQLTNRAAKIDGYRVEKHLRPAFGHRTMREVEDVRVVMRWLAKERAESKLGAWAQRANLHALSRFFSWAVSNEFATVNPVRNIPRGQRPQPVVRRDAPWLDDDAQVRKVFHALPEPFNLIFYLGVMSGLRPGESCGLRLSDLDSLADGAVRVRFSRLGPLKEDFRGEGKVKWAPVPEEAKEMFAPWLARRRAAGAGPEDLVFPDARGRPFDGVPINRAWKAARKSAGLADKITFDEATRHSFTSRALSRGASLDETSAALGHSTPVVTKRHYDHFVRKTFSPVMRDGLGIKQSTAGTIVRLPNKRAANTQP
jgi:integrase